MDLFELELLGGGIERRYRKLRPEVEAMPWGTMSLDGQNEAVILAARRSWTLAAFQEHRTGAACAATLRALIEARAPLDLIALATRFPLDEMVHVELCARMAMELGGGIEVRHEPTLLIDDADRTQPALVQAAELVVRNFCVGEALSIPLLRGTARAATHPLPAAVLHRIVRDEAAHGTFGWTFLDWALPLLDGDAHERLRGIAAAAIEAVRANWDDVRRRGRAPAAASHALGWMETDEYLALAARSLATRVIAPLAARGLAPR